MNQRYIFSGMMFGLIAGAAWGLSFLIPSMLSTFSSLEITLGRYFMYGLFSILLFFQYKRKSMMISSKVWLRALLYAFAGNIGYFFFLVTGIQYAGATVATLIIGALPLTIGFFGNLINKEFPFKIMLLPACFIFIGILLMYFGAQGNGVNVSNDGFIYGFFSCLIAVALWTWYGISNANYLKRKSHLSADLFATIIGIQTFVLVLIFLLVSWIFGVPLVQNILFNDQILQYLLGVLMLGIIASWIAMWAWNQASVRLPVVLAGMIILFETIFGLLYTFIYHARFPTHMEWGSMIFIILGVTVGIWKMSVHKHTSEDKKS